MADPTTSPVATPPAAPPAAAPAAPPPAAAPAAPATPATPATPGTLLGAPSDGPQGDKGTPSTPAPADIKITVPDGFAADKKQVDQFVALAKESGLSQKAAQGIFDQYVSNTRAATQAAETQRAETITGWAEDSRKTFGKEFDTTLANAKRGLERFGNPELRQMLGETGLGNHKAVIKVFADIGAKIAEDKLPAGTAPVTGERTEEDRMRALYPTMFKE